MATRAMTAVGAVLLLVLTACAPKSEPDALSLPDPAPAGATVAFALSGTGPKPVDLSSRAVKAKTVSVHWFCVGKEDLRVTAGGATLIGSGCGDSSSELMNYGGDVPLSLASTMAWRVETGPGTVWRLAVTTG